MFADFEDRNTEFKREFVDDIKKAVVAFANTDGGRLFVGVDDDGTALGLADADDVLLRVTNAIRDGVRPDVTMFTECGINLVDGKAVVVVTIQRGTARPYYLVGKGIRPEGVFVRHGASSVSATESAILAMIKETGGDSFEKTRSFNQLLTFEETSTFFARKGVRFEDTQKKTLGFIGDDGTYTNLAHLLSDQCGHSIKLAVFEGHDKLVFKDRCELSGSLLRQMDEVYDYIDRHNRTRAEFKGLDRVDNRDYPLVAIRESLLNAIVHRDYSFSSSTLVSIFDNRIEIVSIGGLLKGISYNDIMLGVSVLRNKKLADAFYRLRLIEAYGTGMHKIMDSYGGYVRKPKIEVSDNAFKITLPNTNFFAKQCTADVSSKEYPFVERENAVMKIFDSKESIARRDIQDVLGLSQTVAIQLLRDMTSKGLLIKVGSGKLSRYLSRHNVGRANKKIRGKI